MKKTLISTIILVIGMLPVTANAEIIDVSGPPSSEGTPPEIIPAPTDVLDDVVTNTGMQGFDEAQGVETTIDYNINGGVIPAGTLVNSHMIFLNAPEEMSSTLSHAGIVWTFSQPILGIMADGPGNFEAASSPELGASSTNYTVPGPGDQAAPFGARGLEGGDSYLIEGNQITLTMQVSQPGDWMRVITSAPTAEPCINVEKSVFPEVAQVGDIVTYTICVTNCGDTMLMVEVMDLTLGFIFLPIELAPGEEWCGTLEYEIQSGDPDPLVNEVMVTAVDESGNVVELFDEAVVDLIQPVEINVPLDIKPTSCPNPLNVKSKGVLPVAILGTENFDVSDVDVGSVSLEGVAPIRFSYEDVATPFDGELCDCHEAGPDGYLDLTLKFDTQEIVTALGDVEDGDVLVLTAKVTMEDGAMKEASDCIRIIKKGKN